MAFSSSGVFTSTLVGILDGTLTMDLNSDTTKIALYNNTGTPDYDVANTLARYDTGQWATANEVYGTGWAQTGVALSTPTITYASPAAGQFKYDAVDVSESATTLSNIYGCLIYSDTETNKTGLVAVAFSGAPYSTSAGTLAITWDTNGIFYIDVVP